MKQLHSYSQKFLRDEGVLKKIAACLGDNNGVIVEVGSGDGRLSAHLRAVCRKLYCVEIDKRFCTYLNERFAGDKKVIVINEDILRWPLELAGTRRVVLVGNIPYHISKSFIRYCIANRAFIRKAYFMFQREFSDKLLAKASTPAYCALTCFFQYYAQATRLFDVPAGAFSPPPRVASSFIKAGFFSEPAHQADNVDFLFKIIETAFSQRRKKIINSLSRYPVAKDVLAKLSIDPGARAENVSLPEFVALANALSALRKAGFLI